MALKKRIRKAMKKLSEAAKAPRRRKAAKKAERQSEAAKELAGKRATAKRLKQAKVGPRKVAARRGTQIVRKVPATRPRLPYDAGWPV